MLQEIGYGMTRSAGKLTKMNNFIVVLKYQTHNNMSHYILTAYVN